MRIKSIDFLRGVVALLVVFRHIELEPILVTVGWAGVDLFFVISGFLVSNLLFQEYKKTGTVRPIRFLIRRGFKIYPLFYLMIFLLFFSLVHLTPSLYSTYKTNLFYEILFLQNYNYDHVLAGHTWSLAVEEHFYFALALLFFIIAKCKALSNKAIFNILTIGILLLCLIMRINVIQPLTTSFGFWVFLIPTHLRIDTLWVGVFIAYQYNYNYVAFKDTFGKGGWLWLIMVGLGVAACYSLGDKFLATFGLTMIALCFGCCLSALIANDKSEELLFAIFGKKIVNGLAKIGTYSYSIYLFHILVVMFLSFVKNDGNYNSWAGRMNTFILVSGALIIGAIAT